ncbi:hypothetical protein CBR_g8545 [Chara braunii]|uniref:Uncharacterized protein n=1 Tax=Chara braunii TaxID=69332 RepID=A0A388KMG6_CHABU|nr:hypothetical protein CBR_g8545 [Chara braunii]|eukprot:GBG71242.1 hypothetical protein CBR_g8545 [Chara braunii]
MGYNNPMRSNQGEIAALLRELVNSVREKRERRRCEEEKKQKEEQMLKAKEEEEKRREENERKEADREVRMAKLFAEQFAAMEKKKKDDEAGGKRDPAKGKEIASEGVRSNDDKPKVRDGSLKIGDNEAKKRGQEALQDMKRELMEEYKADLEVLCRKDNIKYINKKQAVNELVKLRARDAYGDTEEDEDEELLNADIAGGDEQEENPS